MRRSLAIIAVSVAATVTMVLDAGGRPVKITASGRSASNVFTATETFAHYNKPVTITAP
jgi:hypothetical protein